MGVRGRLSAVVVILAVGCFLGISIAFDWRARAVGAASLVVLACLLIVWAILGRARWGGWALALAALMMLGGGVGGLLEPELETSAPERDALHELAPKAQEFAQASGAPTDTNPYVKGRLVPIDVGDGTVDEAVFVRLADDLQARTPDEVATVVLIKYEERVVGRYEGGGDARQEFAVLTFVDLRAGTQYSGEEIAGPDPPFSKVGSGDKTGGPPTPGSIVDYLEGLPRDATPVSTPS